MNAARVVLVLMIALASTGRAAAQVDGAATTIVIPLVASTVSFTSEFTIKDQSGTARSVNMQFYEATTSGTPGPKTCAAVSLAAFEVKTVTLAGQCTLTPADNHHGFSS